MEEGLGGWLYALTGLCRLHNRDREGGRMWRCFLLLVLLWRTDGVCSSRRPHCLAGRVHPSNSSCSCTTTTTTIYVEEVRESEDEKQRRSGVSVQLSFKCECCSGVCLFWVL